MSKVRCPLDKCFRDTRCIAHLPLYHRINCRIRWLRYWQDQLPRFILSKSACEAIGKNLLDDPAVLGTVVHIRDLTKRTRAEEPLQRQQEILTQNEKLTAMDALLARGVHELNHSLWVIVMETGLLSEEGLVAPGVSVPRE